MDWSCLRFWQSMFLLRIAFSLNLSYLTFLRYFREAALACYGLSLSPLLHAGSQSFSVTRTAPLDQHHPAWCVTIRRDEPFWTHSASKLCFYKQEAACEAI